MFVVGPCAIPPNKPKETLVFPSWGKDIPCKRGSQSFDSGIQVMLTSKREPVNILNNHSFYVAGSGLGITWIALSAFIHVAYQTQTDVRKRSIMAKSEALTHRLTTFNLGSHLAQSIRGYMQDNS
jgi:hypothetical protein